MNLEEEENVTITQDIDICSQINLISSIQYQQNELSKLAKLLQSEKDREKYIKVIEMSKIIQSKLDYLQDEKKKSNITISTPPPTRRNMINSFGQSLDKKNSMWSLSNHPELYYSSKSSSRSSYTSDSVSTTRSSSTCGNISNSYVNDESPIHFTDSFPSSRYHIYNGHSYRVIDRVTSLQFQQSDSVYNSRRPSADTILVDLCLKEQEKNIIHVKPNTSIRKSTTNKKISFAASIDDMMNSSDEDDDEEIITSTAATIHVAVRRDASLFKIEKIPSTNNNKDESLTAATTSGVTTISPANTTTTTNTTIPIALPHPFDNNNTIEKKRISFIDDKKKHSPPTTELLMTPPDSPQSQNQFEREISSESHLDLNSLPQIIHVQKKTHQSLKGLLKRTYQLNQYTVTKTNSTTCPYSTGLLLKTVNSMNGKSKLLLKVVIVSLDIKSSEKQKRFGFTFWWQNQYQQQQQEDDNAKFSLAPDSLVKEALVTWIESQNEGLTTLLPSLSQSDEILRDGRKLYVVYDTSLFP